MPSVNGILETALYVSDPAQSADFYRRLFGFDTLLDVARLIALDVAGNSVLLLFQAGATQASVETTGGTIPGHGNSTPSPTHFAFAIPAEDFAPWQAKLIAEGIKIESTVNWEGGAKSLYFRDLDDNMVELITPGFWWKS